MTHSPVSRTVTCKLCGSTNTAWRKSPRGKWYLVEVFIVDGIEQADPRDFHSIYCGKLGLHNEAQALLNPEDDTPPESEQLDEHEIEMLSLLAGYDPAKRLEQIEQMKLAYFDAIDNGEDSDKLDKLQGLIDLAEDFISELED